MIKAELEAVLLKAVEYYFSGMSAKDAIAKSVSEINEAENEKYKLDNYI